MAVLNAGISGNRILHDIVGPSTLSRLDRDVLLATSRLICLTGAGGVGKTRLAVRLAYELSGHFRDGVWLVDLAPLSLADLLPQTEIRFIGHGRHRTH